MKITGYICCALVFTCFFKVAKFESSQDKIRQQLLESLTTDNALKMKRPFCNAFTGCGRKRSFYESSTDGQETEVSDSVQLPISVYKALLRAASQNIRNTIDRDINDYQLSDIPQVYVSRKAPLRKRLDVS